MIAAITAGQDRITQGYSRAYTTNVPFILNLTHIVCHVAVLYQPYRACSNSLPGAAEVVEEPEVVGEPEEVAEPEVARKTSTDELEAELEMDLDNLKLDDIDTSDVNLDDEDLLED